MMGDGMVYEMCPHCENEAAMRWDVKRLGYQAFCPVCGERLMLCGECLHAPDNTCGSCDYNAEDDSCFRRTGSQGGDGK